MRAGILLNLSSLKLSYYQLVKSLVPVFEIESSIPNVVVLLLFSLKGNIYVMLHNSYIYVGKTFPLVFISSDYRYRYRYVSTYRGTPQ